MKRILIIGGGLIGLRHLQAVRSHPGCTLVGLVDPDPSVDAGADVVRFDDMADVSEPVDGAIIATPTALHAPHGIAAAARGWHILLEKPVAGGRAGAEALAETIARSGVRALVGHHRRHHATVQQLKSLIADAAIGVPVTATLIWAMRKPEGYFDGNWRTAGGSPVMINLVHDIDMLRFVLGEVRDIAALPGRSLRATPRIESGAVALAFESGATATISFADTAPSPWGFEAGTGENPNIGTTREDMMWITGTRGGIAFPSMTLWQGSDWGRAAEVAPLKPDTNAKPPLDAQLDHFLDVIDGAPPLISVADAARTLDVALRIEEHLSAQHFNERQTP